MKIRSQHTQLDFRFWIFVKSKNRPNQLVTKNDKLSEIIICYHFLIIMFKEVSSIV